MNCVSARLAGLLCLLVLGGCKTTSTAPSIPTPPTAGASSSASSSAPAPTPSQQGSAASTSPSAGAAGDKGKRGSPSGESSRDATQAPVNQPEANATTAAAADSDTGNSQEITLEDPEHPSRTTEAEAEQDVLDAALEAMREHQSTSAAGTPAQADGNTSGNDTAAVGVENDRNQQGPDGQQGTAGGHRGTAGGQQDTEAQRHTSAGTNTGAGTGSPQQVGTSGSGAQGTAALEVARLERELGVSLGRFDDTLAGERARAMERAEKAGSHAGMEQGASAPEDGNEDSPGYGTADVTSETDSAEAATPGGVSTTTTQNGTSGRSGPDAARQASATVPADIPDSSADDVVARQIREAAMKEKDPELRERLWDEYRKYTGLTRKEKGR